MIAMKNLPSVSVIIPCYNEEKNLEKGVLDEVYGYLIPQPYPWEVIIVNDESTDQSSQFITRSIQHKSGMKFFEIPHGGKPAAIWAGIQQACGEIVLFTDMDQSTPITEFGKLLPWYEQGFDVVIGSRGVTRTGFSLLRKSGSFVFRNARRLFILHDISDTQCGFKSCRRQIALNIFPRLQFFQQAQKPTGWKVTAYDVELLYLIEKAGYRIREIPVIWHNCDQSDTKSPRGEAARYVNESLEMAQEIIRVKFNQLKGMYDNK